MKRSSFIFATLVMFSSVVSAQYQSANQPIEKSYQKLDEQVGKEYWIKANPNAIRRKKFTTDLSIYSHRSEFVLTSDVKFTVVGWEFNYAKTPQLKVEFEDGKSAYIEVVLWELNKDVISDVFDGTEYSDYKEYIFKGKPDEILAAWKDKKAKQKAKAEADYKAKGGVKIGMTKEQVLKSNWGKPESVNTTTNAGSVREQWVYGGRNYLYFTNGILTGIQN